MHKGGCPRCVDTGCPRCVDTVGGCCRTEEAIPEACPLEACFPLPGTYGKRETGSDVLGVWGQGARSRATRRASDSADVERGHGVEVWRSTHHASLPQVLGVRAQRPLWESCLSAASWIGKKRGTGRLRILDGHRGESRRNRWTDVPGSKGKAISPRAGIVPRIHIGILDSMGDPWVKGAGVLGRPVVRCVGESAQCAADPSRYGDLPDISAEGRRSVGRPGRPWDAPQGSEVPEIYCLPGLRRSPSAPVPWRDDQGPRASFQPSKAPIVDPAPNSSAAQG